MEYLFYYIPQAPNKKCVNANQAQNIPVITQNKNKTKQKQKNKKNTTRTIILNYLILFVLTIFCEITQLVISKLVNQQTSKG